MTEHPLHAEDYEFVVRLLREQSGQILEPGKEYLVRARLSPLVDQHRLAGIDELVGRLRRGDSMLVDQVVEAMVITETSFFRDGHPFESLRHELLPRLIERRRAERRLNIWCAACSSGQEPYSVAILLKEHFPELESWQVNLTATDLSHEMLDRSREGRYSQIEISRGLTPVLLEKWFRQEGAIWRLDERVRRSVTFRPINLSHPWPPMETWDLILLRNVMIYFDVEVKRQILGRVSRVLRDDGYLLLGGAETTHNLDDSFQRLESYRAGFYQRKSR